MCSWIESSVWGAASCVFFATQGFGANIIDNDSFEAGTRGWLVSSERYYSDSGVFVPPKVSTEGAFHGKRCLRVTKSVAETATLVSKPIPLASGKEYALSFYARSDISAKALSGAMHAAGMTTGASGLFGNFSFICANEWKRCAVAFTVPADPSKCGYEGRYCIRIELFAPSDANGSVWFDAFQIEEGAGPAAYSPSKSVYIGFEPIGGKKIPLYHTGEAVPVRCFAFSGEGGGSPSMEFTLENFYYGTKEVLREERIGMSDDGTLETLVELKPLPRGSYKLWGEMRNPSGEIIGRGEFLFGVITEDPSREFKGDSFFGIHVPSAHVVDWRKFWGTPPRYELMFNGQLTPDEQIKIAHDVGAKWLRAFDAFSMAFVHPEPDAWHFDATEKLLDITDKYGMKVMPVMEDSLGNDQWERWGVAFRAIPLWARSEKRSLGGSSDGYNQQLPRLDMLEAHVEKTVAHFKDRIGVWEVWNEPAVKMRGDEYLPILKAARCGAKKADPRCVVVGLCGTGDLGGDPFGWVKAGLAYMDNPYLLMDAISIHSYASVSKSEENPICQLFAMTAARTPDKRPLPVWNTEVGTATIPAYSDIPPERVAYNRFVTYTSARQADFMVGKEVMQMALGLGRHFYFIMGIGDSHLGPGGGMFDMFEQDGAPRPSLIAYDAMTEILEGAAFKAMIDLSADDFCAAFEKDDKVIVCCWNAGERQESYKIAMPPSGIDILDIMGNPLKVPAMEDGFELTFGNRPIYVTMRKSRFSELSKAFDKLEFPKDYSVDFIRFMNGDGRRPCLGVQVTNKYNKTLDFSVAISEVDKGWTFEPEKTSKPIPPRRSELFVFPAAAMGTGESVNVKLTVSNGDGVKACSKSNLRLLQATGNIGNVKLDGKVGDWPDATVAHADTAAQLKVKTDGAPWEGPQDLSATIRAAWDSEKLYLVMHVKDDKIAATNGSDLYNGDCVEIFFDMDIASNKEFCRADNYQFLFRPACGGKEMAVRGNRGGGSKCDTSAIVSKSSTTDSGYECMIAIPWNTLQNANGEPFKPAVGKVLGFDFAIDDNDGKFKQRKSQLVWSSESDAYANPRNYGVIILQGHADEQPTF